MHQGKLPPDIVHNPLPDHPDLALFIGTLFGRLGGRLSIDGQGRRSARRPNAKRIQTELPQLAEAQPWEQFRSVDEWRGAIKLATYWLDRLSPSDKERVYTMLADVELESDPDFDFRASL